MGENEGRCLGNLCSWDDLQLVVSSPLSRALRTADLVVNPTYKAKRVVVEEFREIIGSFLNSKRRNVNELKEKFKTWDLGLLHSSDCLWTEEMETETNCAERGYQGLCWLMTREEKLMLLVCHGGILRFTMQHHPWVKVTDRRIDGDQTREPYARFANCEIRKYLLDWDNSNSERPRILLSEINDTRESSMET